MESNISAFTRTRQRRGYNLVGSPFTKRTSDAER